MQRREFMKFSLATAFLASSLNANEVKKSVVLNNGATMPLLGLGLWKVEDSVCEQIVGDAISIGYRSFDSAQAYANEAGLGKAVQSAIKDGKVKREELFLTTKLSRTSNYNDARKAIDESAKKISVGIDLMLLHYPHGNDVELYKALEDACKEKIIKACGISNFFGENYDEIIKNAKILPVLNQCETHIYRQHKNFRQKMWEHKIYLEAYSQFGGQFGNRWGGNTNANKKILDNEVLTQIAKAHNKSTAQIILAWLMFENIICIPKTTNKTRLKENYEVFDIVLSADDIQKIRNLDEESSLSNWF